MPFQPIAARKPIKVYSCEMGTLQKQVSCFNHMYRVVTLIADKLERQWFALVWKPKCIRQPRMQLPSSSYNHNTLTSLITSVNESLQMYFKVAVRTLHARNASR